MTVSLHYFRSHSKTHPLWTTHLITYHTKFNIANSKAHRWTRSWASSTHSHLPKIPVTVILPRLSVCLSVCLSVTVYQVAVLQQVPSVSLCMQSVSLCCCWHKSTHRSWGGRRWGAHGRWPSWPPAPCPQLRSRSQRRRSLRWTSEWTRSASSWHHSRTWAPPQACSADHVGTSVIWEQSHQFDRLWWVGRDPEGNILAFRHSDGRTEEPSVRTPGRCRVPQGGTKTEQKAEGTNKNRPWRPPSS